ncbi:MAG: hypothetical protein OXF88_06245 [Rhodobacteraceae bacterium]|nr:hypothetical protein [Paracoccaceae bacterium]MCY4136854.1 hypothetical protein [Paracoccaceae bacterium]
MLAMVQGVVETTTVVTALSTIAPIRVMVACIVALTNAAPRLRVLGRTIRAAEAVIHQSGDVHGFFGAARDGAQCDHSGV